MTIRQAAVQMVWKWTGGRIRRMLEVLKLRFSFGRSLRCAGGLLPGVMLDPSWTTRYPKVKGVG